MEGKLSRTIKISKLLPTVNEDMIKGFLSIGGDIESIEIQGTEAIVVFVNKESAENCVMLDNTELGGSAISIEEVKELPVRLSEVKEKKEKEPEPKIEKEPENEKEKEKEKEIPKDVPKECKSDLNKMKNATDLVNVPAKCVLPNDDLFSAVFNKKYGFVVVGLWSVYLAFFSLLSRSE